MTTSSRYRTRRYDRTFDYDYAPPPTGAGLVPVVWDGLSLNTGDQDNGLCSVIENVEGWLDGPPVEGNDAPRAIADGSAWGSKTLDSRVIVLHGVASGPRPLLGALRDQLSARAAALQPAELAITDGGLARTLTAEVRAGSDHFRQIWLGPSAFRWQATLTAADPLLYEGTWQSARLSPESTDEASGRPYPRDFPWRYGLPYLPNTTVVANEGNAAAPVFALYTGDLTESRLSSRESGMIRMAAIAPGMQIRLATATLVAEAAGRQSRASYVLPGSAPMTIPPQASDRWYFAAAGHGDVQLAWRSTWV